MIGELVPEQDSKWDNFTLMLTITEYSFAPVTSEEVVPYLKTLISDHHEAFSELYPSCPIIPKMHYLIHLPDWLLRYIHVHAMYIYMDSNVKDTCKCIIFILFNKPACC